MAVINEKAQAYLDKSEFDLLKYLSDYTVAGFNHCNNKYPERRWMFDIQMSVWNTLYEARETGKPIVMIGAAVPPEIILAFDCLPLLLDTIGTRMASDPEHVGRYLDIGAEVVPTTVCALDRCALGIIQTGDLRIIPEAYIFGTIPCDSSRCVYPVIANILGDMGVPTMAVDTPWRKDDYGINYIAEQYADVIDFLEKTLDKKLDPMKLASVIMRSNDAATMMKKCGDLRKLKPCPGMSRLLVLNGMWQQQEGTQALVDFFRAEYDYMLKNIENHTYPVPDEKYRVTWLQDMIWSNVGLLDWFEKKHKAVVVMDCLGFKGSILIEDPFDRDSVLHGLAQRQMATPMLHASSGPAAPYIELAHEIVKEYSVNLCMFIGHVGCKHTWACAKVVKDGIEDKFGMPTLYLDLDAVDHRYKSDSEIKAIIDEYIESLENK